LTSGKEEGERMKGRRQAERGRRIKGRKEKE
jgi:hypothetical protein